MIGRRLVNVAGPCRAQQTCGPLPVPEGIFPRARLPIFPSKVLCDHKNHLYTGVKTRSPLYFKHMRRKMGLFGDRSGLNEEKTQRYSQLNG